MDRTRSYEDTRLRVVSFDSSRDLWEGLQTQLGEPVLYHRLAWLELLHRAYGFDLLIPMLEGGEGVVAATIFARTKNPFARRFVSLPFSDYCPPLAADPAAAKRLLATLAAGAMRSAQLEVRGVADLCSWHTDERFVTWRLDLDQSAAALESGLGSNFRRNLRRGAGENITISRGAGDDYLRRFYRLHVLARRQSGLPAQPWRFMRQLEELFSPAGDLDIWIAMRKSVDVAAAVLLRDRETLYYKWGAREPRDRSSANFVLWWKIIEQYRSGMRSIDLGRTDMRNYGLMRFKRELGARAEPLPYSFHPRPPDSASPEVLSGRQKLIATIWRHLPVSVAKVIGGAFYRYLA